MTGACPRDTPNRHQQPTIATSSKPVNMKPARGFSARDTLVVRRSLVSDEDLGAEAPTALRGTLLKSAEAYH
jgi:hypothetical protein